MTQPPRCIVLLCSLFLLSCAAPPPPPPPAQGYKRGKDMVYTEPETKVDFKGLLEVYKGNETYFLMGAGVRTKTVLQVKIYAVGLYVAPTAAIEQLKGWKQKAIEELQTDESFYSALRDGTFGKSLRLVMVFSVDAKSMADSFEESLKPRIETLVKPDQREAATKGLEQLKAAFDQPLTKGDVIAVSWEQPDKLHVQLNDQLKTTITSPGLCLAMFDIYLGQDAISEHAKKSFPFGMKDLYAQ